MDIFRSYVNGALTIKVYVVNNQTETGSKYWYCSRIIWNNITMAVPTTQNIASSLTGLLAGQQLLIKFL